MAKKYRIEPPSYGAVEDNFPPPTYEGEGPSNETTVEMLSQNENQQMEVEVQRRLNVSKLCAIIPHSILESSLSCSLQVKPLFSLELRANMSF